MAYRNPFLLVSRLNLLGCFQNNRIDHLLEQSALHEAKINIIYCEIYGSQNPYLDIGLPGILRRIDELSIKKVDEHKYKMLLEYLGAEYYSELSAKTGVRKKSKRK